MEELQPADKRFLDAAEGWLGLGNYAEANEELERITPRLRAHPDVLRVRYEVYAAAKKWEMAAEIAQAICQLVPDDPFGWIKGAYALHELKRTQEAWKLLFPVAHKFPKEWVISYNLSCYSAQLGNLKAAWKWLERAIDLADGREVKKMALEDPDLEPLWTNIAEI